MKPETETRLKRGWGAWLLLLGVVLLIASFVLPNKLHDYVQVCYPLTHSFSPHTAGDLLKCDVATYVVQWQWLGVVGGIILVISGLVAMFFPEHTDD